MHEDLESHFAFGANWKDYAKHVTQVHVDEAWRGIEQLLAFNDLTNRTVLDLGCGSGVHAVAMAQHGARVTAVDIDPNSIAATLELAHRFGVSELVSASVASVFTLPEDARDYEIVYSWGVLHHTGDMWRAIDIAATRVSSAPGSLFVLALYRTTRLDEFWRLEKRAYSSSPAPLQWAARRLYSSLHFIAGLARTRRIPTRRHHEVVQRGMSREHDLHDWLGGFPYESALPEQVRTHMAALGFRLQKEVLVHPQGEVTTGLFGSGCDQFTFIRHSAPTAESAVAASENRKIDTGSTVASS